MFAFSTLAVSVKIGAAVDNDTENSSPQPPSARKLKRARKCCLVHFD